MNQAQALSLTRTLLKVVGTALATHGATKAASIVNSEDVIGLVLAVAALIWSQYTHALPADTTATLKTPIENTPDEKTK